MKKKKTFSGTRSQVAHTGFSIYDLNGPLQGVLLLLSFENHNHKLASGIFFCLNGMLFMYCLLHIAAMYSICSDRKPQVVTLLQTG